MIVLAIDTALASTSLALTAAGVTAATFTRSMERGHQEVLAPATADLLATAGVRPSEIERIGVTVGPGSFTGLRVGLAFAKGLALALETPLVGVTTLECLAAAFPLAVAAAAIDAGRDRVYLQIFRRGRPVSAAALLDLADAEAVLAQVEDLQVLTGSGAARLTPPGPRTSDRASVCDPLVLARLTEAAPLPDRFPAPLYIREPDALTLAQRGAL